MSFQTEKQVDDKVRMNLLDHLTQATETKTEEKIEIVKLQLERETLRVTLVGNGFVLGSTVNGCATTV